MTTPNNYRDLLRQSLSIMQVTSHNLFYYGFELSFCGELYSVYRVLEKGDTYGGPYDMFLTFKSYHVQYIGKWLMQAQPLIMSLMNLNPYLFEEGDYMAEKEEQDKMLRPVPDEKEYWPTRGRRRAYRNIVYFVRDFLSEGANDLLDVLSTLAEEDADYRKAFKNYQRTGNPRSLVNRSDINITSVAEYAILHKQVLKRFTALAERLEKKYPKDKKKPSEKGNSKLKM